MAWVHSRTVEPFGFDYRLHRAGWATAWVRLGPRRVSFPVSYLHDSLSDVASAVRALCDGAREVRAVFMDEPGEHQLLLRRAPESREVEIDVRWFSGYQSFGMRSDLSTSVLSGRTTLAHVRGQILSALTRTLEAHGTVGYRTLWRNADFPADELAALRRR